MPCQMALPAEPGKGAVQGPVRRAHGTLPAARSRARRSLRGQRQGAKRQWPQRSMIPGDPCGNEAPVPEPGGPVAVGGAVPVGPAREWQVQSPLCWPHPAQRTRWPYFPPK